MDHIVSTDLTIEDLPSNASQTLPVQDATLRTIEQMWASAKSALADHLEPDKYKSWIEPLKIHSYDDGRLILAGPNPFFIDWVKTNYLDALATALATSGFVPSAPLEFITEYNPGLLGGAQIAAPSATPKSAASSVKSFWNSNDTLGERFTFENFVVGDSNLYAFSAIKALAGGAALGSDAIFLTSDHGLGKSHLAQALGQNLRHKHQKIAINYLTAEDFTNEMTGAIRHGTMEEFKAKYRHQCDLLVLEEIQFLSGKEKIQTELCFTLDCLLEKRKKVVFTSPQEPKNIPRLGNKLRSLLSTALVSPIGPPEFETRLNILNRKAKALGLKCSQTVLEFVAERVTTDVRRLESCLGSLKAKSQLLNRQIDLDMAREALTYLFDEQSEGALTPLTIRSLVCKHFHLEVSAITSKSKAAKITEARDLGIYLARHLTPQTLEEIGKIFGRTHSSVLYAINKMDLALKRNPKLVGKVEHFTQLLLSN